MEIFMYSSSRIWLLDIASKAAGVKRIVRMHSWEKEHDAGCSSENVWAILCCENGSLFIQVFPAAGVGLFVISF